MLCLSLLRWFLFTHSAFAVLQRPKPYQPIKPAFEKHGGSQQFQFYCIYCSFVYWFLSVQNDTWFYPIWNLFNRTRYEYQKSPPESVFIRTWISCFFKASVISASRWCSPRLLTALRPIGSRPFSSWRIPFLSVQVCATRSSWLGFLCSVVRPSQTQCTGWIECARKK